jgi:hypothetical protein
VKIRSTRVTRPRGEGMHTSAVVFIHCSLGELRNLEPFRAAAEFPRVSDCIIRIRCDDTGEELQTACNKDKAECWGALYFKREWERKHGTVH